MIAIIDNLNNISNSICSYKFVNFDFANIFLSIYNISEVYKIGKINFHQLILYVKISKCV